MRETGPGRIAEARLSRRRLLAAGLALGAGFGAGLGRVAAAAGTGTGGTVVEVDGVPLHLVRMGRGRPVVLIHGASGNLNDMTFRLGPMLAARYEVIAIDRPGHGRSGLPPGGDVSLAAQAALIRGAMARIGVRRPLAIGHSYGGSVALAWAVEAPETLSGLALLAAPSQVWEGGLGIANDLLANPLSGPVLARAASHVVGRSYAQRALKPVFAPQAPPEGYLDHLDLALILQPASLRENARQLVGLKEQLRPMVPRYPRIALPVALVHGEADTTVGLEIHSAPLARQIPQARLTRLPGVGHMLHQVATRAVAAAVDSVARA